jgi:hypothetical protein
MMMQYWPSGFCCCKGSMFLQKAGNHSSNDTLSQIK